MSEDAIATAILLAAGGSKRLGRAKQLLPWNGSTLLGVTIERLVAAGVKRLVIVLGAYESQIREHCIVPGDIQLEIVTNQQWSKGQSTSLRAGIDQTIAGTQVGATKTGATLIALCDQPLIGASHYQELLAKVNCQGCYASATEYPEGFGVPACFSATAIQRLSLSVGDSGAKKWLRGQSPGQIECVPCPAAKWDIDTEHDYHERLNDGQVI